MRNLTSKHKPLGWAAAFVLVVFGFVGGLTISGNDNYGSLPQALTATSALASPQTATSARSLSYADVAELTMPAVVNISTDKIVENNFQHPFLNDPLFRRFFDVPEGDDEQPERIQNTLGSGVVISDDGYILTANHVVERASKIRVSFQNNEEYDAEIVGTDPQTDVALIKIDAEDLAYLVLGDSDKLRVGDEVMAIGNPFGVGQTVTKGIVSAKGRSIGLIDYEDLIQTDATINPGNSGGALVNMEGALIGMNTAILSRSGGSQGIGFAVPSNMADRILTSLREDGSVQRAWIGVAMREVDQAIASYYGMRKPRGVMIDNVTEASPAEKAGLQEGDIILAVDGTEVNSMSQLRNKVSLLPVDHEAQVAILREGKDKQVGVMLEAYPESDQLASRDSRQQENAEVIEGVTVNELNRRIRRQQDLPEDVEGLLVTDVARLSNAASQGLVRGDVIVEVGGQQVRTLEELREEIEKKADRPIFMRIYSPRTEGLTFMAIPR